MVRVVDDDGAIEIREDLPANVSLAFEEQISIEDTLHGRAIHQEVRSEFLAMLSEHGAVTMDAIPVPVETIEELGFDLPETYFIKVALTAVPPALETISQYYSQEVTTDVETFEG